MNCSENELRYTCTKGRPQKFSFYLLEGCWKFLDFSQETAYDTWIHPLSVNKIELPYVLKIIFTLNYQFEWRYELLLKRDLKNKNFFILYQYVISESEEFYTDL